MTLITLSRINFHQLFKSDFMNSPFCLSKLYSTAKFRGHMNLGLSFLNLSGIYKL